MSKYQTILHSVQYSNVNGETCTSKKSFIKKTYVDNYTHIMTFQDVGTFHLPIRTQKKELTNGFEVPIFMGFV